MGVYSMLAVFGGAGLGACLRWWLGLVLNPLFPTVPLGTLAANLVGGYLIGIVVAVFSIHTSLPPELRLLVVTGFMGGLTTFSTFSSEVVALLLRGEWAWAVIAATLHVLGSLALTVLGLLTVRWVLLSES